MIFTSLSSSSTKSCFQCQDTTSDCFNNGWRLRSGDLAQLCPRCSSAYKNGSFCATFHKDDEGWRDCESCGKLVHCGCIVSFNAYFLLDFGGIICMECSRLNLNMARKRCLSSDPLIGSPLGDSVLKLQIGSHYWPRVTVQELQLIARKTNCVVTPLFEKVLTASDSDIKLARIVIPKKCAEAFLPEVSEPHGFPIKILDTEGKEWEFHFRYWPISGGKMYVLEGLKEFMIGLKWQAGDAVIFYRTEPEGKLVVGVRKISVGPLHIEDQPGSST